MKRSMVNGDAHGCIVHLSVCHYSVQALTWSLRLQKVIYITVHSHYNPHRSVSHEKEYNVIKNGLYKNESDIHLILIAYCFVLSILLSHELCK